ncbi:MAG TPA: hypothetical protein VK837_05570 [Longimicrobiales bacterium]|nr:hypothetical protein [Longimicrobiales bacterium]
MSRAAYEDVRAKSAWMPREDRTVLALEGRDPTAMLQGLASNDVRPVSGGRCVYATLLDPKGRMLSELRALQGEAGAILLDVPTPTVARVREHFARFVPPRMARLEPSPHAVLGLYGPGTITRATPVLGGVAPSVDEDALTVGPDGLRAVGTRYAGLPGLDFVAPAPVLDGVAAALGGNGVPRMDPDLLDLLRIEAGSPRWGAELDEGRIPIEAGLTERAINQTKGCYTGQEVIIRILHRGHVNWHLRGFQAVDDAAALATGDELTAPDAEKVVARVTSAAVSPRLGPIALGYARRELDPGALLVGPRGGAARLTTLPFPPP